MLRSETRLPTYEAAQQAYQKWSAQCEQQSVLPFQALTRSTSVEATQNHGTRTSEEGPRDGTWLGSHKIYKKFDETSGSQNLGQLQPFDRVYNVHTASPFKSLVAILFPSSTFQPGTRCQRPQCAAVMDIYGDHLLYCERGPHRMRRHDAQVKLLAWDLAKDARHPVVEEGL